MELQQFDYAKFRYAHQRHHTRWAKRVETRNPQLLCQECGGSGGEIDVILDDGSGPFEECGWCEGTGLMDGFSRYQWLEWQKQKKALDIPTTPL